MLSPRNFKFGSYTRSPHVGGLAAVSRHLAVVHGGGLALVYIYIYIYICTVCIFIYVYIYIYIYIYMGRERDKVFYILQTNKHI